LDPLDRLSDVGNREVGQRKGIAWARSPLVDANRWDSRLRLPPFPFRRLAILQLNAEKLRPEASGALGIVSGELYERQR
jgi:hypothetical protein